MQIETLNHAESTGDDAQEKQARSKSLTGSLLFAFLFQKEFIN
jgi:hypothetical protein